MGFYSEKKDTNIDNEFNGNKNIFSVLSKYKYVILILIGLVLVVGLILLFFNINTSTNYLELVGEEELFLYQGSDYVEFGYNAYNSKGEDLNSKVSVTSNLNINEIGEYEVTYTLGEIIKIRKINIVEKEKEYTFIRLNSVNNSVDIYIKIGEKYNEPGFRVFNSAGKDLNDLVTVSGDVDTSKKGTYKLTYSLVDENNVTVSATRLVIVMDSEIILSLNNKDYTNGSVTINIIVADNYFDYLLLPDNTKVTESTYSYTVSKNGIYEFTTYNSKGVSKSESIEVKNIDKTVPGGTCKVTHNNNGSIITITASDTSGISKYIYNGKTYTSNKITLSEYLTVAPEITIYDTAGNSSKITCSVSELPNKDPVVETPSDDPVVETPNKDIVNTSFYSTNNGIRDADIVSIDVTDLSCTVVNGYFYEVKKISIHRDIAENFHGILGLVCDYVNETPWMENIQHDGTYVSTVTGYHSRGLAIDMNDLWTYTYNGKKYRPYSNYGTAAWSSYKEFVCEVCDGKEDCPYNINYIIYNRYFKGNGWCWGGNWGPKYYDPMHFELTEDNECTTSNKQEITCD